MTKKRRPTQLRETSIQRGYPTAAAGSVLITMGQTRVLCTASISSSPPPWLPKDPDTGEFTRGWVTGEYSMLPGSTPDRKRRGPDSRSTEIQRLIGRALRAAVDLEKMPGVMITCDCDVLCADGGTRTAAITGAFVALSDAISHAMSEGLIRENPITNHVAAISVGVIDSTNHLDLDYPLDSNAEVDMNVVMNGKGKFIEIQGTGEQGVFDREQLNGLLDLATKGIKQLIQMQKKALKTTLGSCK